MTQHHLYVIFAIDLMPVKTLLVVVRPITIVRLSHNTVVRSILSEIRVGGTSCTILVEVYVVDWSECESIRKTNLSTTSGIQCVAFNVACIHKCIRDSVWTAHVRTERSNSTVSIVVCSDTSLLVEHDIAFSVAHVDRIDRRDIGEWELVGWWATISIVSERVVVVMAIAEVGTQAQPRLNLIVRLETWCESLVVRSCSDTIIAKIVYWAIESTLVGRTVSCNCVFLTERVVVDNIFPIIRSQIITVGRNCTESGVRIKLAVGTNHLLTVRNSVYIITETISLVVDKVGVSPLPGLCRVHVTIKIAHYWIAFVILTNNTFLLVYCIVIESPIPHFVVSGRILYCLILRNSLWVRAPLCINSNNTVLSTLSTLGSDKYNTVTTTRTVKGSRGSILQYCHRLYVSRVDIIERATIRRTVKHNERVVACIDWVVATNTDRRSRAWLTWRCVELHTSSLTF